MLMQLVEKVEKDLQNTTKIKNRLNTACDVSWSLLCPPGTGNAGKFIAEKPRNPTENKNNPEGCSSLSKDLYSNVTDLINFGKLVRSNKEFPNKRDSVRLGYDGRGSNKVKQLEKTTVKNRCSSFKTGRSTSLETPRSCIPSINRDRFSEGVADSKVPGRHESSPSATALVSYSHSCSLKLSGPIYSIKMSEDLNHLFRLFNSYVNLNSDFSQKAISNNRDVQQVFSKTFKKRVKSKLQNDLQSTNQCEKYMKYVDMSEDTIKNKKFQEPPLIVHYRSKEQLELFETTSQKLLELQLQSKLLNIIDSYLTDTHDETFK